MANSKTDVWIKNIGTKRGAPYVYLDAAQAARAGFAPGEKFSIDVAGQRVTLTKRDDGSRTVSKRLRNDQELPVIDINSKELLSMFEGMDAIRVVVSEGVVHLLPLASEIRKVERVNRIRTKLSNSETLKTASLSHGGGILSHAIHSGLKQAGIDTDLAFVNELRDDLIIQAMEHNDAWSDDTRAIVAPMQEVVQDDWLMQSLPKVEILEMGLPCSGASKAGVAKRGLTKMEDHPEVGHLAYAALRIIDKVQPVVMMLENVPDYASSASAQILRLQMRDMGYHVHEAIIDGKEYGCLEDRVRWCMLAVTNGVEFDFTALRPTPRAIMNLGQCIDPAIGLDAPNWRSFDHLKDKAVRDKEAGKGFKMQIISPADTKVPTIRKGYHKGGSTDPLLAHPQDPNLLRLLTAREVAHVKEVPAHLQEGMSNSQAIQMLGQGITYHPWECVGKFIGQQLLQAMAEKPAIDSDNDESDGAAAVQRRQRCTG